jgi:hypothetical protein
VSVVIEASQWRALEQARADISLAWYVNSLHRRKRLPALKTLLGKARTREPQTQEEVKQLMKTWAAELGLRFRKVKRPRNPMPLAASKDS